MKRTIDGTVKEINSIEEIKNDFENKEDISYVYFGNNDEELKRGRVSAVSRPLNRTSAKMLPSPSICITRCWSWSDASRRTTSRDIH